MLRSRTVQMTLCACLFAGIFLAQTTGKIDFVRDVQPIFQENCISCHGPSQQMNGLRLDRRSSVIRTRMVVPQSLDYSFLYAKVSGTQAGPQMPPTGALRPQPIDLIKKWIEQGADWAAIRSEGYRPLNRQWSNPCRARLLLYEDLINRQGGTVTREFETQTLLARRI
jgi:hypothetical protein